MAESAAGGKAMRDTHEPERGTLHALNLSRIGRLLGYAGKPNQKAAEVQTKYIIVDMYAKAIQGVDAVESVKAAHAELVTVYGT